MSISGRYGHDTQLAHCRKYVGHLNLKIMYLKKIIRIRLPDEIFEKLNKMKRKSEYIRCAIREKMERDNILKKEKLPF